MLQYLTVTLHTYTYLDALPYGTDYDYYHAIIYPNRAVILTVYNGTDQSSTT